MSFELSSEDIFGPDVLRRAARELEPTVLSRRELRETDLIRLDCEGTLGVDAPPLVSIRSRHHTLARLLAEGRPPNECAILTGYTPSRISILQADPTFAELVEHYRSQVTAVYVNIHERLAALGLDAVEELQSRLEEDSEGFSKRELLDVAALALDRSGYGPKSAMQVNHTHVVTNEFLGEMKAELQLRRQSKLIEHDHGAS